MTVSDRRWAASRHGYAIIDQAIGMTIGTPPIAGPSASEYS